MSLTNNFDMKSSADLETVENASSSKSYFPIVTLAIVVISVEPMNGDKPDNLHIETTLNCEYKSFGTYGIEKNWIQFVNTYKT